MRYKLYVCCGASCSGKTSYCNTKNPRLHYDNMWNYREPNLDYLIKQIKKFCDNENRDIYLDGYPYTIDKNMAKLQASLDYYEVVPVITYAPYNVLAKRQHHRIRIDGGLGDPNMTLEALERHILSEYITISNCLNNIECKYIDNTDYDFKETSIDGLRDINNFKDFEKLITELGYLGTYQTLEVLGKIYKGFSGSEETWERIKGLTDWKDKSVLDVGCSLGHTLFEVEKEGAYLLTGLEYNLKVLEAVRTARNLKSSKAVFKYCYLDKDIIPTRADIVLALNIFHHFHYPLKTMGDVFNSCKDILIAEVALPEKVNVNEKVIEIGPDEDEVYEDYHISVPFITHKAKRWGFEHIKTIESHRKNRAIVVYKRKDAN